jgi:hypothetical protein
MDATDNVIQPSIRQHDGIRLKYVFKALAAALPLYAPDFENIGEVGVKAQAEGDIYRSGSIVDHLKPLMANALP